MASNLEMELEKLKNTIIKINNLVENQVFEAMGVLLSEPISEKKAIKKTEVKIDKLDLKIEEICQNIFALQQPVASDLRFIMSAMSMSNEIERIGDLSINIIKLSKKIDSKNNLITAANIEKIARDVESITIKTNMCFQKLNNKDIPEIFTLNANIKKVAEQGIDDVISAMEKDFRTIKSGANLVIVLKHMERIGEHCTNIAESVYFMINAKTIRHDKDFFNN